MCLFKSLSIYIDAFLYLMKKKIICLPTYPNFSDRVGSGETKIFLNLASVPRSRSVRSDAFEHGSNRTRHHSDVSRSSQRDSNTHRETISLRHADPGEHSSALMIRHCLARSRSRSYNSVSLRRHSLSPSRSRGKKKKSHKKRKHSSTSSFSSRRTFSSSSRERERKWHKSKKKKKKHSKSRSSKRDKREKKHKRKRSPSPSPSSSSSSVSSDSSSALQRSPARKKSRINSRSPSPADDNPHSASRTASPASHRDHLSLFADNDDEFNSQSEDNQALAPDAETQDFSEIQSEVSTDDMGFQNLVEEVFKLLPADMFPRKTEEVFGGNRPRSSIELEIRKATKKSISLPQSRRPLIKAVNCLNESLGASEVDGSLPMPPTITQDWVPSRADTKKLVKLKYYQAHNEFLPTANASLLDPDANPLGMSLTGFYPVKVTAIKDLETLSRDTIRLLSHAETCSFAAFKSLQSENMDSKVLLEILKSMSAAITDAMSITTAQTLGLQQLRCEAAIKSAPKGFLTEEAKRKLRLSSFTSKLLFDGQVGAIYKENSSENQEILIRNTVSNQAKPNPSSSSSKKPKAKSGKKKPKLRDTPKMDFSFPAPRPPKRGTSYRGSSSRGRGGGPSHRGASAPKKH